MPINRNALIRYKTIDRMLRGGKMATLQELIDSCSDALLDYCGIPEVSRRTIQQDIHDMRNSEALGYYAPIEVYAKKYYRYSRTDYSISQMPLTAEDMVQLSEAVDMLKQMSVLHSLYGVDDVVNRLEDYVASMRFQAKQVILLENNERLKGLEHITPLHDSITQRKPVVITYRSFRNPEPQTFSFSPYILKEFRNRWFVFGKRHNDYPEFANRVMNLALDRIEKIDAAASDEKYETLPSFNPEVYFSQMIGVTREMNSKTEHIVFRANANSAPYIRTKPLHESQKEVRQHRDGGVSFSIDVIVNRELERDILGFGDNIMIISPKSFVERIKKILNNAIDNYQ